MPQALGGATRPEGEDQALEAGGRGGIAALPTPSFRTRGSGTWRINVLSHPDGGTLLQQPGNQTPLIRSPSPHAGLTDTHTSGRGEASPDCSVRESEWKPLAGSPAPRNTYRANSERLHITWTTKFAEAPCVGALLSGWSHMGRRWDPAQESPGGWLAQA